LVFGAALVIMMIFRPEGLIPPKPARYKLPKVWEDKCGEIKARANGNQDG
jgi:hypothetical protein